MSQTFTDILCTMRDVNASIYKYDFIKDVDNVQDIDRCKISDLNNIVYFEYEDETLRDCIYSLLKGEFDKDTESFKQTCKALKIKHTYKAIKSFIYE